MWKLKHLNQFTGKLGATDWIHTGQMLPFHGGVPLVRRISCCYMRHHDSEVMSRLADVLKHCGERGGRVYDDA